MKLSANLDYRLYRLRSRSAYVVMDAISIRLQQLEHIESALYSERQATIQRRLQEDNDLQLKRQIEDDHYFQILADRDLEEDVSGVL